MIVADASAILEVLLRTEAAPAVEERIFASGVTLHAPHLIDLEIAQVLRRYGLMEELDAPRALQVLDDLAELPLHRYPHEPLLVRIWELRHNLTAYDAAYAALAEALGAPLLTRDRRLASAHGLQAEVELL